MRNGIFLGSMTLAVILAQIGPSVAAGAVALGLPSDVAKDGVSIGTSVNRATMDETKAVAIKSCKTDPNASTKVAALCKVVATFENQCVAIVVDPNAGTPGFGWAVAETSQRASQQAVANCQDSDGPAFKDGCQSTNVKTACDGTAK
jgi:hypothetical protein